MLRLVIVCFAVMCACPCGTAEEKASSSSAEVSSVADRLLAIEKRIVALESRPFWQPAPEPMRAMAAPAIPQGPAAAVAGNAQAPAMFVPAPVPPVPVQPHAMVVPPPQGGIGAVVASNALSEPLLYKVVSAKEKGGEVVVTMPLGAYRDDAWEDLKSELVIDGKDVRLIDARGKAVDKKDALGRLAKRAIVGVAFLNQPIEIDESSPPRFLKDVPEDTMVILIPDWKIFALWGTAYSTATPSPPRRPN